MPTTMCRARGRQYGATAGGAAGARYILEEMSPRRSGSPSVLLAKACFTKEGRPAARVEQHEERARAPVWRDVHVLLWSTDYRPGPLAELAEATPLAMGPGVLMAEALSTSSCAVLPHRHGGDA